MKRDGFAAVAVLIGILALALIGGIVYVHYYYLPQMAIQNNATEQSASTTLPTAPMLVLATSSSANAPTSSLEGSWVNLKINGSSGPVTVTAGSQMNLTWTSQDVDMCYAAPDSEGNDWLLSGKLPLSGNKTITAPPASTASDVYEIMCTKPGGNSGYIFATVAVNAVPLASAVPSLSISLASSAFPNPYQIWAVSPSAPGVSELAQNISDFSVVVGKSEGLKLNSITVRVNPDISKYMTLTSLQIYALREGSVNGGLSNQIFGKATNAAITPGQSYTFTDSMAIPATGQIELIIMGHVSQATQGTYDAPFQITQISGTGMTGGNTSFFSGSLNGQSITVEPPIPTISPTISLGTPVPTTVSRGTNEAPITTFSIQNPSSQRIDVNLDVYLGATLQPGDLGTLYWYDETGTLLATSTADPFTQYSSNPATVAESPSGMYSYVDTINNNYALVLPPNATKTITLKGDILSSAIAGHTINPTFSQSMLLMEASGSIVKATGLPINGDAITIQ